MSRARRRTIRVAVGAVLGCAVLVLAACSPTDSGGADSQGADAGALAVDVDVDTPQLRAAKQRAGIADCPRPNGPPPRASQPLPEVTLPCLGGGPDVDLASLRGPLVINLWAQWCPPCRKELPYYQQLHETAGGEVRVLGIDYQDPRPDWAIDLLAESGVTYPNLADPGAELRVPFRLRGLPGVVFVDRDGEVVAVEYIAVRSYDELAGLVEEHLGIGVGDPG